MCGFLAQKENPLFHKGDFNAMQLIYLFKISFVSSTGSTMVSPL